MGQRLQRAWPEEGGVGGHRAPAETLEACRGGGPFYGNIRFAPPLRTKEHHAHAELFRKSYADLPGAAAEEGLGKSREQAGTIAAAAVGVDTTPVGEPGQRGQSAFHDLVRAGTTEL